MVALLVFIIATLDGKDPFGGNVFKNPASCTNSCLLNIQANYIT